MKQLPKPVQFGVVPFAASVDVGASNKTATWMDTNGLSPIHHEIFTYPNTTGGSSPIYTQDVAGIKYARGNGWTTLGDGWKTLKDKPLTRFTFFDNIKRRTGTSGGQPTYAHISWEGCVESRPYPYNVNDAAASTTTPATLFVPMFAPDEVGNVWTKQSDGYTIKTFNASNSWWDDQTTSTSTGTSTQLARQKKVDKYFVDMPQATSKMPAAHEGPNSSCTTTAILPLTDVSTTTGVTTVKNAIDAMESNGATNVPEGMAWGWRVISHDAPFTEGRAETEKGNDKVVIVLTDGANTYYTPDSLGFTDNAGMKSTYSSYGYTQQPYNGGYTRLFLNTSNAVVKTDYSNDNYTKALNEQFATLCTNAKAGKVIVMTVSLDLSSTDTAEKAQIDALKACSSESRFRKGTDGKPAKLYWNTTGSDLAKSFKEIADELSNLRIVS
jgi:hypothetical protein